ncbi:MAG TPA: PAS domain S-box protein, partial [Duganella sp.]|nr:PAS domain S-box protein [Duganella sp.]
MNRVSFQSDFVADALALIGIPACVYGADGLVLAANAELIALLECDPGGQPVESLFARHLRGASVARMNDAVAGQSWDSCLASASGRYIAVQVWAKPLPAGVDVEGGTIVFHDISDVQRSQRALRKTLLEHQAILENAAVGILFSKGQIVRNCNRRMAEMFGYAIEDMIGMPASGIFPSPESYEAFASEARARLDNGKPFESAAFEFRRKDGALFWCRVRANAMNEVNTDGGAIWILEDVTTTRQTQMEVEAIMTNASMSILFTKNRIITRYNRGFGDMFCYPGDSGLGLPGRALYPSQQAYERLGAEAYPYLSVGRPFQTEIEMRRADDTRLWAQLIGYVVNPADPTQGTIWVIEDRTEQKLAEEALRNALLENQAILDSAVLGISVVERGLNLRCNTKMEELFGYGPGEMNHLSVQAFYADLDAWQVARAATAQDFRAGRVNVAEYQLVRKDGSRFWARLSGRPFDLAQPGGRSV